MRELFTERRKAAFFKRIAGTRLDECWPWIGHRSKYGYGGFSINEKDKIYAINAHRISYALFFGEIPNSLTVDHLCRNRICVNPYHLRAVTNRQNILAGMCEAAQNARKIRCKRGHLLRGSNLLLAGISGNHKKIRRICRTCAKIRKDAWDERNR